jgi:Right handed beta helix region
MRRTLGLILAGACVLVGSVAGDAAAAVIRVPTDFSNIQPAIDAAANGDRIIVQEGIYFETIVINKNNLWIVADGKVQINPGGCGPAAVLIAGNGNRFQGFEVLQGAGIRIEGDSNSVVANHVHDNCGAGISLAAGARLNLIIANVSHDNSDNGFSVDGDAGKRNAFLHNVAFFNGDNGLVIMKDSSTAGNVTTRNASDGFVVLGNNTKVTAQNNVMLANGDGDFWDHDVEIDPDAKVNLPNLADQNVFRSLSSNIFD